MFGERDTALLRDIVESARIVRRYLDGVSYEAFLSDTEKQDAVLRRFEILGEAAEKLSAAAMDAFPALPFRSMRGMRNVIAHDYGDVDFELVWNTAQEPLRQLLAALENDFS